MRFLARDGRPREAFSRAGRCLVAEKSIMEILERDVRSSKSDGTTIWYPMSLQRIKPGLLGKASSIRFSLVGHTWDTDTVVVVSVYETSFPHVRPMDVREPDEVFATTSFTEARPASWQVDGPFGGFLDVKVGVQKGTAGSGVKADFEIWATLLFD